MENSGDAIARSGFGRNNKHLKQLLNIVSRVNIAGNAAFV
jgi:hypothetical protein